MQNHQSKETIYCVCQVYEEEDGQRKPEREEGKERFQSCSLSERIALLVCGG